MRLVVLCQVSKKNLIMPGKRENCRPNPRPAPTFAIFKWITLHELLSLSVGTAYKIVHNDLGYSKVGCRWVPKMSGHKRDKEQM